MTRLFSPLLALALAPSAPAQYLTGVTARASSEQVAGIFAAGNVVADKGLAEAGGRLVLADSGYGTHWQSGYLPSGADETPLIDFDLGERKAVGGFRVWNHNGQPHRGLSDVTVYASDDGVAWRTVPQRFRFAPATGKPDYEGEEHLFRYPVTARHLRFWADGTHRRGGQPDLAGLGKVRFLPAKTAGEWPAAPALPPADSGIVNVKDAPYGAKGDGVADDTAAIQRAIDDTQNSRRTVYLPAGTYLVSATLKWTPGKGHGNNNLSGAGRDATTVRLKDGTFTDPKSPKAVLANGFHGKEGGGRVSADWFRNHVRGLTIDTGTGNPGATGVRFYSNNEGSLRDVTVGSGDGAGVVGLDLAPADQNGPLLVKNVTVVGFDTGVRCGATVNSQTLEHVRLEGQAVVGLKNDGQCLTVRGLTSVNRVPAVVSTFGVLALVDAELRGTAGADLDAVTSREVLFARNVRAPGYKRAVRNDAKNGTPSPEGDTVAEFVSVPPVTLGGAAPKSLGLPVRETPDLPSAGEWANVRHFRRVTDLDETDAIQRAIDSGAAVVYFPTGLPYRVSRPVEVRGKVVRLAGCDSVWRSVALKGGPPPMLTVGAGASPVVFIDRVSSDLPVRNPSGRALAVIDCGVSGGTETDRGDLYLDDVVGDWAFGPQNVWARQLNAEREGIHLSNAGGKLWILGLKTERAGPLVATTAGGRTEVIGGLCYTTTKRDKPEAMFTVEGGGALSATLGEVCYTGHPYALLAELQPGGRRLARGQAPLRPSFLQGSALPLLAVAD